MSAAPLRIGISTCPNDTFAFHALMEGAVDRRGLELDFFLGDIEALNERFLAGSLDVAKVSFHAALEAADDLWVLPSGSALGRGNGPLLLAAEAGTRPAPARAGTPSPRVLCPGARTTATLLWRLFHGAAAEPEQVVFSEIMPALERGAADFGVCIHEGRFTWRAAGLHLVEDLGARWEQATGLALPLGGIVGRRALGRAPLERVQACIADSLDWGLAHRGACETTMARHAQELAPDVLWAHVDLYVNPETRALGERGRAALNELCARAREAGVVPAGTPDLCVL